MASTGRFKDTRAWCYDCYHGSHTVCKGYIGVRSKAIPCQCTECYPVLIVTA